MHDIETASLFNVDKLRETFRIEDFRDAIEKQRRTVVDVLARKYASIHTMMLKIEESVNNSDTGSRSSSSPSFGDRRRRQP